MSPAQRLVAALVIAAALSDPAAAQTRASSPPPRIDAKTHPALAALQAWIEGGTDVSAERLAMMMVGSVISVSTSPPTNGAERGRPKKLRKTASPRRPKTIEGTAARLLMLTSIRSVQRFLGANSSR